MEHNEFIGIEFHLLTLTFSYSYNPRDWGAPYPRLSYWPEQTGNHGKREGAWIFNPSNTEPAVLLRLLPAQERIHDRDQQLRLPFPHV
jgi:hypothetical protein